MKELRLKSNVQAEPLVQQWYAWAHLISPATAARNVTQRHMRIMSSYLSSPAVHAGAVANPKMLGGPFIDLKGDRSETIKALAERTRQDQATLFVLSEAIDELNSMLQQRAKGESLQSLYEYVPQPLKGYVELFYELNGVPSFRFIEPLLYRSEYYNEATQSLMLSTISTDDRPFILSTPRLEREHDVHLKVPFRSVVIDKLFASKHVPIDVSKLAQELGLAMADLPRFETFFTENAPPEYVAYRGDGVRWRYFGHACILLETSELTILVDPVLSYTYETNISRYTYDDLPPKIDYVLITHNHQDHVLLETMLQIRHKVGCVVVPRSGGGALQDPSLKLMFERLGFADVRELDELEVIHAREGSKITALPFFGEHADLNIRTKAAYCFKHSGRQIVFAADSCNLEPLLYRRLLPIIGEVDVLFLGMECDGAPLSWLYGPLLSSQMKRSDDQSRRLSGSNCRQGRDLIDALQCKEVYVYAMGQEPWLNYVMSIKYTEESNPIVQSNLLIEGCRKDGILAERLFGERELTVR